MQQVYRNQFLLKLIIAKKGHVRKFEVVIKGFLISMMFVYA